MRLIEAIGRLRLAAAGAALCCLPAIAQGQEAPPIPLEDKVPIALLVDVNSNQVLYAREADRRFVPASVTKVMTIYHAFELIEEGKLALDDQFEMQPATWREWSGKGSTMFIPDGASVEVRDLLMGIANVSANDGSMALAEGKAGSLSAWLNAMNSRARALGMNGSHFATPNGWPDEGRTFTTAHDLVKLGGALVVRHPEKMVRFIGQRGFRFNNTAQDNSDPMIGSVEGADGIKTGYTSEAGYGYLGTVKRGEQRLIVVVAGAQSEAIRADAARGLIEWGFGTFERVQIAEALENIGSAKVQNGSANSVRLRTAGPIVINVAKGRETEIRTSIVYEGPLHAPITEGSEVASLRVEAPGAQPARYPLVADHHVRAAGFFGRIWNGMSGWFA